MLVDLSNARLQNHIAFDPLGCRRAAALLDHARQIARGDEQTVGIKTELTLLLEVVFDQREELLR